MIKVFLFLSPVHKLTCTIIVHAFWRSNSGLKVLNDMKQQYSITVLKRKIAGWMMMWYWSSVRVYGCGPAGCWVWLHVSHQHVPICVQSRPWAWCGNHHRPCVQPQPAAPDHRQIQIIICFRREADTISTDSVPTDAIPTIHSQDDPVHL